MLFSGLLVCVFLLWRGVRVKKEEAGILLACERSDVTEREHVRFEVLSCWLNMNGLDDDNSEDGSDLLCVWVGIGIRGLARISFRSSFQRHAGVFSFWPNKHGTTSDCFGRGKQRVVNLPDAYADWWTAQPKCASCVWRKEDTVSVSCASSSGVQVGWHGFKKHPCDQFDCSVVRGAHPMRAPLLHHPPSPISSPPPPLLIPKYRLWTIRLGSYSQTSDRKRHRGSSPGLIQCRPHPSSSSLIRVCIKDADNRAAMLHLQTKKSTKKSLWPTFSVVPDVV